jgi:group II intron reverse transcriptase/maturase
MDETKGSSAISTRLEQIARLARKFADTPLTTLAHHIDIEWLREAYRRTRKDGARGIDGQGAEEYAADLEGNLGRLLERVKSGSYRAPPVRRAYIPKANGEPRALGIPTFEDKVLQRAVAMVLEAVYEQEFLDCSYGFRPARSAHQAIDALHRQATVMAGGWAIEVDIRKYFDTIDHRRLQEILRQRVRDGVIVRLVGKWLNAGVMQDGELQRSGAGTPQGGVISPLLANIYLHTVLDMWFEREVRPRLRGRSLLTRYADDAVLLFEYEDDARRVMEVLPKRFERYGLTLHPDKTRLVRFKRPDRVDRDDDAGGGNAPGSFDFLGFTAHWGKSLDGKWVVKTRTAKDRFRRALVSIAQWCKRNRHAPLEMQQQALSAKLRGHYGYYRRIGNSERLWALLREAKRLWWRWLSRRSQRARLPWTAMDRLLKRYPLATPARPSPA